MTFLADLLQKLRGATPEPPPTYGELLGVLGVDDPDARLRANLQIARNLARTQEWERCKPYARRALLLSNYRSEEALSLFARAYEGDAPALREAYKRAGFMKLRDGDLQGLIDCFHKTGGYDPDVAAAILQAGRDEAEARGLRPVLANPAGRKLRVGHLIFWTYWPNVSDKINLAFAAHHDREAVDLTYYVLETPTTSAWMRRPEAEETQQRFRAAGAQIVTAPDHLDQTGRLVALADRIAQDKIDVLVLYSAKPIFQLMGALRPAPLIATICLGTPHRAAYADVNLHYTRRTMMEDTGRCAFVPIPVDPEGLVAPDRDRMRKKYGLKPNDIALVSVGTDEKYLTDGLWKAVGQILDAAPGARYFPIGLAKDHQAFVKAALSPNAFKRVHLLGFKREVHTAGGLHYYDYLKGGDVYLDLFPRGGGLAVIEAMYAGLPIVTMEGDEQILPQDNDRFQSFGHEYLDIPELAAPFGNVDAYVEIALRLIREEPRRRQLGKEAQALALSKFSPRESARILERHFQRLVAERWAALIPAAVPASPTANHS